MAVPVDPQLSKMLIMAERYGVADEVLSIAAMLQIGAQIFYRQERAPRRQRADQLQQAGRRPLDAAQRVVAVGGDAILDAVVLENFIQIRRCAARDIREQIEGLCERVEIELEESNGANTDGICKAITAGFFYHGEAAEEPGLPVDRHPQTVHIHPSSALHKDQPRWVVYHELVFTTKEFMRQVVEIKPDWLVEIAPHYYKAKDIEDASSKKMPKGAGKAAA